MSALSSEWDPEFHDLGVTSVRAIGGLYRTLRASTFDPHRSLEGPTFRLACGEPFRGRLLLGILNSLGTEYQSVLLAFIDHAQVAFELDGSLATAHRLTLQTGREHTLDLRLSPLSEGIHRLVLVLLDGDQKPGLSGAYDLFADLHVGASPASLPLEALQRLEGRADDVVRGLSYGVALTQGSDKLQLVSSVDWRPGLTVWASFWGSIREVDRPVALVVLQDFEQLPLGSLDHLLVPAPDRVATVPFVPRSPTHDIESIRFLMFTNPQLELAPAGPVGRATSTAPIFRAYASQKAYVKRSASP